MKKLLMCGMCFVRPKAFPTGGTAAVFLFDLI